MKILVDILIIFFRIFEYIFIILWSIYWVLHDIIINWIFVPIMWILLAIIFLIPNLVILYISSWMRFFFKPFDDICYWMWLLLDLPADILLALFPPPTWHSAWIESWLSFPL